MKISCLLPHNYSKSMFRLYPFKKKLPLKLLTMSAYTLDIVKDNLTTYDNSPEMPVWVFVCAWQGSKVLESRGMAEMWNKKNARSERTREEKKGTESRRKRRNSFFWVERVEKKDKTSIKIMRSKGDKAWIHEMRNKDNWWCLANCISDTNGEISGYILALLWFYWLVCFARTFYKYLFKDENTLILLWIFHNTTYFYQSKENNFSYIFYFIALKATTNSNKNA